MNPIVSISCITYNHAPYLRECLESFLMQKTAFSFEVMIHDDCSTDGTQDIIKEYAEKYPNIFFPLIQKENQYSKGVRGMMARFNFPRCRGKYLALCEGDDYWTDPYKLQKQVDFLEANKEFTGCGTNSMLIYQNRNDKKSHPFKFKIEKDVLEINDLIKVRPFHTATFVFRKIEIPTAYFNSILSGDRLMFLLVANHGKVKVLEDITTVYRKNEGGLSMMVTSKQMKQDLSIPKIMARISKKLDVYAMKEFVYHTIYGYSHTIYLKDYLQFALPYFCSTLMVKRTFGRRIKSLIKAILFVFRQRKKINFK